MPPLLLQNWKLTLKSDLMRERHTGTIKSLSVEDTNQGTLV